MSDDLGAYILLALIVGVPILIGYRHITDGSETLGFKVLAVFISALLFLGIVLMGSFR